ncbi:hypothetical protein D3C79_977900 [compost metagenome]
MLGKVLLGERGKPSGNENALKAAGPCQGTSLPWPADELLLYIGYRAKAMLFYFLTNIGPVS